MIYIEPTSIIRRMLWLGLILGISFPSHGQVFKLYLQQDHGYPPTRFEVSDLIPTPDGQGLVISGDIRTVQPLPSRSYAYYFVLDRRGQVIQNSALTWPNVQGLEGFRGGQVQLSPNGDIFLAHSFSDSLPLLGEDSHPGLAAFEPDGKLAWVSSGSQGEKAGLCIDDWDNSLVSLGSQPGPYPNERILSLNQFKSDGTHLNQILIQNGAANRPLRLLDLPQNEGFLALAIYDTVDLSAPYLLRFDAQMNLVYAHVLLASGHHLRAADLAYHPDGFIYIGGTATDSANQVERAFLAKIGKAGQNLGIYYYQIPGIQQQEGTALATFTIPKNGKKGLILGGAYQPNPQMGKRAFIWRTDLDGNIGWVWNYSGFPPMESQAEEGIEQIAILVNEGLFAAAGKTTSSYQGQIQERKIWVSKAELASGDINMAGTCAEKLKLKPLTGSLSLQSLGTTYTGSSFGSQGYGFESVPLYSNFCSFGEKTEIPTGISPLAPASHDEIPLQVELWTLSGQRLQQAEKQGQLDTQHLSSGMYLIKTLYRHRIEVQKWILPLAQ